MAEPLDLICYLHPGWRPHIRPASPKRDWMDATPESFAYRCLPLNIANAHGWEILTPCGFDARWSGAGGVDSVELRLPRDAPADLVPVSLFGQGTFTFHIAGLFRTPPGWNLWVGGSPNHIKDGAQALGGIIETDWSPFTFTMNWRVTRPNHWVRFEAGEPICFFFPVPRAAVETFAPKVADIASNPELLEQFTAWSKARDAFHELMRREPGKAGADKWQKHYYRGVDVSGRAHIDDHRAKLRVASFGERVAPDPALMYPAPPPPSPPQGAAPSSDQDAEIARLKTALAKRDWLLDTIERQRELAPSMAELERRTGLSSTEFLERYYAPSRPVVLADEMNDWPALRHWTPAYLRDKIGAAMIEYQGERSKSARFEMHKDAHRRQAPFNAFIDLVCSPGAGNDAYITAYNSARNSAALAPLHADLGALDNFLTPEPEKGMMWIGPAGTKTSLHHDLTNNLIAQIVGRKEIKLIPACDVAKLYNHRHVFSEIIDVSDPDLDWTKYPLAPGASLYDVILEPGEILFVPIGWWHQVRSLDFSVTLTYTNFLWPNEGFRSYPSG